MDMIKGAEILRRRFEQRGHPSSVPRPEVDASALPIYRWSGVQPRDSSTSDPGPPRRPGDSPDAR